MAKPTWHGGLPWDRLRFAYRRLRSTLFSIPEPTDRPALTVDATVDELTEALGSQSWAPNWEYSYDKGEDLNLARVEYAPHPIRVGTGVEWWQYHVRGWPRDDVVVLRAHYEPAPTEHPRAHLDGVGHSLEGGMQQLRDALDEAGIGYVEGDQTT